MLRNIKSIIRGEEHDSRQILFLLLLIGAVIGLYSSFTLSIEALELAKNPEAVLACDLNQALSCSAVGRHWSSYVLGFPNSFVGMMAMSVMITVAMAALMGARLPRVFMFFAQLGVIAGVVFAAWMFYMSYFIIQALCPWCLTVDLAVLVIAFAVTRYNVHEDNLHLPEAATRYVRRFVEGGYDILMYLTLVFVAAIAIYVKYGSSF